jgi:hypothetical protein
VSDFFWRVYLRALSMPEPKFVRLMNEQAKQRRAEPVKIPALWQVMILPLVILTVAVLVVML